MDTTSWLIVATVAGPVADALVTPGFTRAVLRLARSRAQRVQHVEASGADLYNDGVPLTETQFREAWAAMQAELDQLPPAAERNDWQLKRQYAASTGCRYSPTPTRRPSPSEATQTTPGSGTRRTVAMPPAPCRRIRGPSRGSWACADLAASLMPERSHPHGPGRPRRWPRRSAAMLPRSARNWNCAVSRAALTLAKSRRAHADAPTG
jgi:hypothetical protein